jgi:uncharacterized protein
MRYAAWIDRHRVRILVGSVALALVLAAIAARLTVQADLSYLLPPDAASVVQLRAIEHRARVLGTVMVAVESADTELRARAARRLRERLGALVPDEVSSITADDAVARRFAWQHRWQFAPLSDLIAARDAVRDELAAARRRANPLYVELDDAPAPATGAAQRLRDRLREAERTRDAPAELVSRDGTTQLVLLRTAYPPGDIDRDRRLLDRVDRAIAAVVAEVPGVEIGTAGDVVLAVAEHDAIVDGMLLAVAATVTLVLAGLLLFYRSLYLVGALSWALLVGTLATFAFARLAVGHLNLATAFLSSIVVGNGINFGIVVVARYQEARRADATGVACLATTLRSTFAGTLAAALAAAVAYGSLLVTSFRGFRDFAVIAGVGIALCWVAAYTVLPAALAIAARRPAHARRELLVGRVLARLAPAHPATRAAGLAVVLAVAGAATWRYLAADPFEQDFRRLRSTSAAIERESRWMERVDRGFGQGISGGYVIAVADRADAAPLLARLRAHDAALPTERKLFARLESLDDLVPSDQPARLAVLGELRALLADRDLDLLEPDDAATARALRPPADLAPVRDADVPDELAWPYTEADGTRGRIILAMPGWGYDNWSARDIVRYADDMRALDLGPHVLLGGSTFVFADMIALVARDGPRATLAAIAGAALLVLVLVGRGRHGLSTLACGAAGTLAMLALAATVGLRINFLDFVALPITIGIGIDYAVNLAARDRHDTALGPRRLLARTGAAVLLCSFTTIVGYGSLLLSRNHGIRSFGAASILGEATSLAAALVFVPALLVVLRRASTRTPSTIATGR